MFLVATGLLYETTPSNLYVLLLKGFIQDLLTSVSCTLLIAALVVKTSNTIISPEKKTEKIL